MSDDKTDRQRQLDAIQDAIKAGRRVLAGTPPAFDARPDFTVTAARLHCDGDAVTVTWQTATAGFGELVLRQTNGRVTIDNEGMSRAFILDVLRKLVADAELIG